MIKELETILRDAVAAPSGENCQPWRFVVHGDVLSLYNDPKADLSLYNASQKGSYVAHGALLENLTLSAQAHGYKTKIDLFPTELDETHVADIFFEKSEVVSDVLYNVIHDRSTNRKEYRNGMLSIKEQELLISSLPVSARHDISIVTDTEKVKILGQALAGNEKVLFENKLLHDFFYKHIIWKKRNENKSNGFFIDTLEFLPHQLTAVKLLKYWKVLTVLNSFFSVSKKISHENGEKYAKGGTFAALMLHGFDKKDYVVLGRSVQRLWLQATAMGVAMHPCNGIIYLVEQICDKGGGEFTSEHKAYIKAMYKDIYDVFSITEDRRIGFIFRMGKADKPTAVAKRLPPNIVYI